MSKFINNDPDKPRDACGVFGISDHPMAVELTYLGLYSLQHRGQESAGIVSMNGDQINIHRDMGLVAEVFNKNVIKQMKGHVAIGHVRYSTTGSSLIGNAQPLFVDCAKGKIAIGHNGNLTNSVALKKMLETEQGSIFQTTSDSEIFLHLIAKSKESEHGKILIDVLQKVEGAYSLIIYWDGKIIAIRDPYGFRPLCLGELEGSPIVASETTALDHIQASYVRDIEPGEVSIIEGKDMRSVYPFPDHKKRAHCVFEYIYFSRPDSNIFGDNVHQTRKRLGAALAKENPVDADYVISVPDSGNSAAMGYSEESGIPFEMGFIRNHYIGRTFLQPSQILRDDSVNIKLNPVRELIEGKRIIVVDDSIVRGTTSRSRIKVLRKFGAKEIHLRISCPPHVSGCFYGIDFPSPGELLASKRNMDEIKKFLQVESIGYLSIKGMLECMKAPGDHFCTACFSKEYPTEVNLGQSKLAIENNINFVRNKN